ncbi:unnamed protein product [Urochloa decumbens]|uniref:Dirigent protein n=1 Tax=Urochloa decumbens TaxID=240449 RepID=A0ABC9ATW1_9POAL
MARPSHFLTIILISPLAMVCPSFSCPDTCKDEINLSLYLRQASTPPNPNQEVIYQPEPPKTFGAVAIMDWTLLDAPVATAKVLGHAQGVHVMSDLARVLWYTSFNLVFQGDRFNGSTLQVMGVTSTAAGEWAIVGGTGQLAMASGTIKHQYVAWSDVEYFRKIDIHALYTSNSMN